MPFGGIAKSHVRFIRMPTVRWIASAEPFGREAKRILPSRVDGVQGKLSCVLSHRLREVFWRQGGRMGLMPSSRHSVCIRESASPALCHSQGFRKLAWRSRAYGISKLLEAQVTRATD